MFRRKGENLHAIYVLLFLNIAFFLLEHQDAKRFAALFSFTRAGIIRGELWRLFTYQFTQAGQGWFFFPRPLVLFFNLLLLYLMGNALEEEWERAGLRGGDRGLRPGEDRGRDRSHVQRSA